VEQLCWRKASADMTCLLMKVAESAELVPWVVRRRLPLDLGAC
jgi:hypothetical protein